MKYLVFIMLTWLTYIQIPFELSFARWRHYRNLFLFYAFTMHQAKSLTILFSFMILFYLSHYFNFGIIFHMCAGVDPHLVHVDRHDSLSKEKKEGKACVFEFWKIHPRWGTVLFGFATYFYLFFKGKIK